MLISAPIPLHLSSDSIQLPIYRGVSCGWPSPAADFREPALSLDELVGISACSTFLARATGTSMTGAGIHSGDILVIDKSRDAQPGNVVVAVVDGEFTVKRLARVGRQFSLVPENPTMAPLTFGDGEEVTIWGIVTWTLHRQI
jgi:DNA polymerase V